MPLTKEEQIKRVALELKDGYYVNLGIGMPTLVANYISPEMDIILRKWFIRTWSIPGSRI